ncbi:hypothetical protein R6Z07_009573 [Ovis aries]
MEDSLKPCSRSQVPSSLAQLEASSEVTLRGEHCWVLGKADGHEHSVGPAGGSKAQQTGSSQAPSCLLRASYPSYQQESEAQPLRPLFPGRVELLQVGVAAAAAASFWGSQPQMQGRGGTATPAPQPQNNDAETVLLSQSSPQSQPQKPGSLMARPVCPQALCGPAPPRTYPTFAALTLEMWTNGPEVDKTWQGLEVLGDCCPGAAALESELVQDTRPQSPAGPPLEDRALATLRVRLQHRLSISLQVRKPDQSRFHRLIPGPATGGQGLLGPSGAPCGPDPGRYPPSPCPQVLLPLYRLPAGRIEASSPRRRQQLLLQWPVSKGSTQQTTVGAVNLRTEPPGRVPPGRSDAERDCPTVAFSPRHKLQRRVEGCGQDPNRGGGEAKANPTTSAASSTKSLHSSALPGEKWR